MAGATRKANTNNPEQSVHLVNPIIQTWKYETLSDLWHWLFIIIMCCSYQMNEETPAGSRFFIFFSIAAAISHPNPSSFSQWILFSPYILLNLPSFQFNPNSPSSMYHPVCLLVRFVDNTGWWVWFFPRSDLFLRVNTGWPFCDLIGWLVPSLEHAS